MGVFPLSARGVVLAMTYTVAVKSTYFSLRVRRPPSEPRRATEIARPDQVTDQPVDIARVLLNQIEGWTHGV